MSTLRSACGLALLVLACALAVQSVAADVCNSNLNCTSCAAATATSACGWCASTNTCSSGSNAGPYYATCSDWRYNQCGYDWCTSYASCSMCALSPGCGWCAGSNSCSKGASFGPSVGTCSSGWAYVTTSCPAPACSQNYNCASCAQQTGCGWCGTTYGSSWGSSGSCKAGYSSGATDGSCSYYDVTKHWISANSYQCYNSNTPTPAPAPRPASSAGSSDVSVGGGAVGLVISSIVFLAAMIFICKPSLAPKQGSEPQQVVPGQAGVPWTRDFASVGMRLIPVLLTVLSKSLKTASFSVNHWAESDHSRRATSLSYGTQAITYGLVSSYTSAAFSSTSYDSLCNGYGDYFVAAAPTWRACDLLRTGFGVTLAAGIIALFILFLAFVFQLTCLCQPQNINKHVVKLWRMAGLTAAFSWLVISYWAFAAYFAIRMNDTATLGASFILFAISCLVDVILALIYRRGVLLTPAPVLMQLQPAMVVSYAHVMQPGMMQQPQPGMAYPGPVPHYAPAGYGPQFAQPVQQYAAPTQPIQQYAPIVYNAQPAQQQQPRQQPMQQQAVTQEGYVVAPGGYAAPPANNPSAYGRMQ